MEIRTNQRLRCEIWFDKNSRLRRPLLLLLPLLCVCSVLYGSYAKGVIRRHRGALCRACMGRRVRCAYGAVTRPRFQSTATVADHSHLQQNYRAHRAAASAAAVDKVHVSVIDVATALCQPSAVYGYINLSAFAAASR